MASSFTPNKGLEQPANSDYVDTWNVPVNADWGFIDDAFGGLTSLNVVAASGTVALTVGQYRLPFIYASGLLTASVNYQLPTGVKGMWSFFNNTTGAFTVTFSSADGGSYVIPQGYSILLLYDGLNMRLPFTTAPLSGPITGSSATISGPISGTTGTFSNYVTGFSFYNNATSFLNPAIALLTIENASGAAGQFCYSGSTPGVAALSSRLQNTAAVLFGSFYQGSNVGNISTNGTTTTYGTTSDEDQKDFTGYLRYSEASAMIMADPVRQWKWNGLSAVPGRAGTGWGAQTSHKVNPDFAVPGSDELDENGKKIKPWQRDDIARIPYLWASQAGALCELETVKAELAAIKEKIGL